MALPRNVGDRQALKANPQAARMDATISPRQLLPALLGLRGLAAVAVVFFHLHHLAELPLPPSWGFIGTHFGLGVQLFFVLSGFSLCHSTIGSLGRQTWLRDYCIKRFFRIAPLFYVMLAAWVGFFWLRGVSTDLATLVLNLSFTFNLVPGKHASLVPAGWTIGVEMLFYVLLPLLLATIHGLRGAMLFLVIAVAISSAGRVALTADTRVPDDYPGLSLIASLGIFAAGIAAYHLWRVLPVAGSKKSPLWPVLTGTSGENTEGLPAGKSSSLAAANVLHTSQGRGPVLAVALATVALAGVLCSPWRLLLLGPLRPDVLLWGLCFALLTIWQAAAPWRLLASLPMQFLGDRSYSIYLLHPLVIIVGRQPIAQIHASFAKPLGDWAFFATAGVVTAAVVVVSILTHWLIEEPGIRAGRWLIKRLGSGEPPTTQPAHNRSGPRLVSLTPQASVPAATSAIASAAGLATDTANAVGWRRLLSGEGWSWGVIGLAMAMLAFSAVVTLRWLGEPLVDIHAFRQTQTALTADWMVREGYRLDYQTPVAGAPWSIPFEFPIYQALVAAIVRLTGSDLSATGRLVSWVFLVACAWPAFALVRRLRLPSRVAWTFCGLLWSAPLYVYWGRTFMIETAALFFAVACLPWWVDVVRDRGGFRSRWLFLAFASLAVLQKSTTAWPLLLFLMIASAVQLVRGRRWAGAIWGACLVATSLGIGLAWAAFSDHVKAENPLGQLLSGGNLATWNFGSLRQKLDPKTWQTVAWWRGLVWNAGGPVGVLLLLAPWVWRPQRFSLRRAREARLVLAAVTLFLLPTLIFTNLHLVHEYYQVASVAFVLAALAVVIGAWLPRATGFSAVAPVMLAVILVSNITVFGSYYGIVVARPLEAQDPLSVARYQLGHWLHAATPEGSGLVVFGQDYSSELPFHAGRRALVCPAWYAGKKQAWEKPEDVLGGLELGAIVVSSQADMWPTVEVIRQRVAEGGWRQEEVHGSVVLLPDTKATSVATEPLPLAETPLNPDAPPTDPGDSTTVPR